MWTEPDAARARLCPVMERRCIADQCMAWDWDASQRTGRCALAAAGLAAHALTHALALATVYARAGAGARLRLAVAGAELALVDARQGIERAILDATPPDDDALLTSVLNALADRGPPIEHGARGAGQSPAGGVGNTPPAKCAEGEKANDSKPIVGNAALVEGGGGGPVRPKLVCRPELSPAPRPASTGPCVVPLPNGTRVRLPDGREGTVRHQRGNNLGVELDGTDKVIDAPRRTLEKL